MAINEGYCAWPRLPSTLQVPVPVWLTNAVIYLVNTSAAKRVLGKLIERERNFFRKLTVS